MLSFVSAIFLLILSLSLSAPWQPPTLPYSRRLHLQLELISDVSSSPSSQPLLIHLEDALSSLAPASRAMLSPNLPLIITDSWDGSPSSVSANGLPYWWESDTVLFVDLPYAFFSSSTTASSTFDLFLFYGNTSGVGVSTGDELFFPDSFFLLSDDTSVTPCDATEGWSSRLDWYGHFLRSSNTYSIASSPNYDHSHTLSPSSALSSSVTEVTTSVPCDSTPYDSTSLLSLSSHFHPSSTSSISHQVGVESFPPFRRFGICESSSTLSFGSGGSSLIGFVEDFVGFGEILSGADTRFIVGWGIGAEVGSVGGVGGGHSHVIGLSDSVMSGESVGDLRSCHVLTDSSSPFSISVLESHDHVLEGTLDSASGNSDPEFVTVLLTYLNTSLTTSSGWRSVDSVLVLGSGIPPLGWERDSRFDGKVLRSDISTFGTIGGGLHSHDFTSISVRAAVMNYEKNVSWDPSGSSSIYVDTSFGNHSHESLNGTTQFNSIPITYPTVNLLLLKRIKRSLNVISLLSDTELESWNCFGEIYTNASIICSGQGNCSSNGTCNCNDQYDSSPDCSVFLSRCFNDTSLDLECSGHGTCVGVDQCSCEVGFTGEKCEVWECWGKRMNSSDVCGGNGASCIGVDLCVCVGVFSGEECSEFNCSQFGDCSGHGACMLSGTSVSCSCQETYDSDSNCSSLLDLGETAAIAAVAATIGSLTGLLVLLGLGLCLYVILTSHFLRKNKKKKTQIIPNIETENISENLTIEPVELELEPDTELELEEELEVKEEEEEEIVEIELVSPESSSSSSLVTIINGPPDLFSSFPEDGPSFLETQLEHHHHHHHHEEEEESLSTISNDDDNISPLPLIGDLLSIEDETTTPPSHPPPTLNDDDDDELLIPTDSSSCDSRHNTTTTTKKKASTPILGPKFKCSSCQQFMSCQPDDIISLKPRICVRKPFLCRRCRQIKQHKLCSICHLSISISRNEEEHAFFFREPYLCRPCRGIVIEDKKNLITKGNFQIMKNSVVKRVADLSANRLLSRLDALKRESSVEAAEESVPRVLIPEAPTTDPEWKLKKFRNVQSRVRTNSSPASTMSLLSHSTTVSSSPSSRVKMNRRRRTRANTSTTTTTTTTTTTGQYAMTTTPLTAEQEAAMRKNWSHHQLQHQQRRITPPSFAATPPTIDSDYDVDVEDDEENENKKSFAAFRAGPGKHLADEWEDVKYQRLLQTKRLEDLTTEREGIRVDLRRYSKNRETALAMGETVEADRIQTLMEGKKMRLVQVQAARRICGENLRALKENADRVTKELSVAYQRWV